MLALGTPMPTADVFDHEAGVIVGPRAVVELTPLEARLVAALARRAGKICSRHYLVMEIWPDETGAPVTAYEKALNGLVARTREKLAAAGLAEDTLHTRRLMGYVWRLD